MSIESPSSAFEPGECSQVEMAVVKKLSGQLLCLGPSSLRLLSVQTRPIKSLHESEGPGTECDAHAGPVPALCLALAVRGLCWQ